MAVVIVAKALPTPAESRAVPRDRLMRYYCVAHRKLSVDRSPVTLHDRAWASCLNGCDGAHDWREIVPITYSNLVAFGPRLLGVGADDTTTDR